MKALEMLSFLNRGKKAFCVIQGFSTSEQCSSDNNGDIIPTDCSEGFGMSIDW